MKGTQDNTSKARKDRAEKDILEDLFQYASARERPPTQDEKAIREALHSQWREMARRRNWRRFMISAAAAASVALAVWLPLNLQRGPEVTVAALQLATVDKVLGNVLVHPAGNEPVYRPEHSLALVTGQTIVTGNESWLGLRWEDGTSLRMDQDSELRFTSTGEVELVRGRLYADTQGADPMSSSPVILTPAGPVMHLGTQYMTHVTKRTTRVSVREGKVALGEPGKQTVALSGEQLSVDVSGTHSREEIQIYGVFWDWAQDLAPDFVSDGRSITDFLDWVGRESGRDVTFASPQAERVAADTLLRGSVELEPMRALGVMLQTTDFVSEVSAGTIVGAFR